MNDGHPPPNKLDKLQRAPQPVDHLFREQEEPVWRALLIKEPTKPCHWWKDSSLTLSFLNLDVHNPSNFSNCKDRDHGTPQEKQQPEDEEIRCHLQWAPILGPNSQANKADEHGSCKGIQE